MLKTPTIFASYLAWTSFPFPTNPLDASEDTLLPGSHTFNFTTYPHVPIRNHMSLGMQLNSAACLFYFGKRWVRWKSINRFERWWRLNKIINMIKAKTQRTVAPVRTAIPRAMGRLGCKSTGTEDFRFNSRRALSIPPEWSACQCFGSSTERKSSESKAGLVWGKNQRKGRSSR